MNLPNGRLSAGHYLPIEKYRSMDECVKYGNVEIHLPDENLASFSIFQDLTKLFGVEFQSEAIALLKSELKSHTDLKPKPCIEIGRAHV